MRPPGLWRGAREGNASDSDNQNGGANGKGTRGWLEEVDHMDSPVDFVFVVEDGDDGARKSVGSERLGGLDEGRAVGVLFFGVKAGEHNRIAKGFALSADAAQRKPNDGIKPVQGLNDDQAPVEKIVATAHVNKFVQQGKSEV